MKRLPAFLLVLSPTPPFADAGAGRGDGPHLAQRWPQIARSRLAIPFLPTGITVFKRLLI
jgi:hypothetical protein